MDRVTRYPIFSIPHSGRVGGLPTDPESHYTFDAVKVESVSPGWEVDIDRMNSGGQSFKFGPERTSGLRVMTVTQETVSMPHLVKESQHVLTGNYSANRWTPSWDRKSQSDVMKMAYPEERCPGRLYYREEKEEEEQLYHLGPGENIFLKRSNDLEQEGQEAVKRSSTVTARWNSQEELDSINSAQGPSSTSASDSENVIDTDQINFLSARKQFMNLEKLTSNPQPAQKPVRRTMQTTRASPEVGSDKVNQSTRSYEYTSRVGLANGYTVSTKDQEKDDAKGARPGLGRWYTASRSSSLDQLSLESVDDASTLGSEEVSTQLMSPDEVPKETPIEREIRRAQEREADLRQQRGLQRSGSRDELVEITARPLLNKVNLHCGPTPKKGKDKGRPASLYIQREIALDNQREEDHRRQAGLSEPTNSASRASTPSQLTKELSIGSPKIRRAQSSDSILSLTSDTHPMEAHLEGRKINRIPLDAYQPYLNPHNTKQEFVSYYSYKPGSSLGSGSHTVGSRQGKGVATSPPYWDGEQIREQSWKSQASTIQRQEPRRSPLQDIREQSWKSQASTIQRQEPRRSSFQDIREQSWKSQASTIQRQEPRRSPLQEIREQAWKSQASTIQRQEPRRSPLQEYTHKSWETRELDAGDSIQGVVPRNYFQLRPMNVKITFSRGPEEMKVPQQEHVWEPKGYVEEVAIPVKPVRSQSSSLLEMEIQNVLQRERELVEERRNALFPEVFSPATEVDQTFEWGELDSNRSSVASGITGSYSVSETPTFSPVHFHSGLMWKVTDQTPDSPWKMKRDIGYAGIDISDSVNTEIVEATRVNRHKNTMATRWEARMYASEDED